MLWVLANVTLLLGFVGNWLVGSEKRRLGWSVSLVGTGVWLTYTLVSGQPELLTSVVVYATVHARNLVRHTRRLRAARLAPTC